MKRFNELGISEPILRAINEKGFSEPTYIQEKSIPLILEGKDVVGQSYTGSGKTLAFGSGIIQNTVRGGGINALVLTPTRELAEQVSDALKDFSRHKALKVVPIYGGIAIEPQMNKLKSADVVVATPGRMLDHIERRTINLSKVKIFVLDEADRMVDMGFFDDVNRIMKHCPRERQTLLFSATITPDIEKIRHRNMKDPISIFAKSLVDPSKLRQEYYDVRSHQKFSLLVHLLSQNHSGLAIVFCNTRVQADFVSKNLKRNNIDAVIIHGGYTQSKRSSNMERFQSKNMKILVCTDVAARGLDIPDVSHVYNYDLPKTSKEYIHRIGRTARAGKNGKVVNLLSPRDHENFARIQRDYSNIMIENMELPTFKKASYDASAGRTGGRRKGGFRRGRSQEQSQDRRRNSHGRRNSGGSWFGSRRRYFS